MVFNVTQRGLAPYFLGICLNKGGKNVFCIELFFSTLRRCAV